METPVSRRSRAFASSECLTFPACQRHSIGRGEQPIVTRRCNTVVFLAVRERDSPSAPHRKTKQHRNPSWSGTVSSGNSTFVKDRCKAKRNRLPEATRMYRATMRILPNSSVGISRIIGESDAALAFWFRASIISHARAHPSQTGKAGSLPRSRSNSSSRPTIGCSS